jgi:ATP-dependent exoDNAse (exonuclease V) beta subunit
VAPSGAAADARDDVRPVHAGGAEHGRRVHLLLQLATETGSLPPGTGAAHDEARGVLDDPRLSWVFGADTADARARSEAPLLLRRADGEVVAGVVDRLVVRPDRVDVVDYKTNRWGGDPTRRDELIEHYRPQMAAYAEAAAALFPGLPVRTWLLLTDPAGRSPDESGLVEVP